MRILLIDIGNSTIVFATPGPNGSFQRTTVFHNRQISTDQFTVAIQNLMSNDSSLFTDCAISSVVPSLVDWVSRLVFNRFAITPFKLEPGVRIGMPILYHRVQDIGPDRIANALAAWLELRTSAMVIDFGTATTFTVVDSKGAVAGGMILPGIHAFLASLHLSTERLPDVSIETVASATGRSTVECIRAGFQFGYPGMIDRCIEALREATGGNPVIVGTGGAHKLVQHLISSIHHWNPDLTLTGILNAWLLNRPDSDATLIW